MQWDWSSSLCPENDSDDVFIAVAVACRYWGGCDFLRGGDGILSARVSSRQCVMEASVAQRK
jgi:hypothetical protein